MNNIQDITTIYDGMMVKIVTQEHPMYGYHGEAQQNEKGGFSVWLNAVDPEDDRVIYNVEEEDLLPVVVVYRPELPRNLI